MQIDKVFTCFVVYNKVSLCQGQAIIKISEELCYDPVSFTTVLISSNCISEDAETNITYVVSGERGIDNEDYILIGPERIAVRNNRIPTYFVQPSKDLCT